MASRARSEEWYLRKHTDYHEENDMQQEWEHHINLEVHVHGMFLAYRKKVENRKITSTFLKRIWTLIFNVFFFHYSDEFLRNFWWGASSDGNILWAFWLSHTIGIYLHHSKGFDTINICTWVKDSITTVPPCSSILKSEKLEITPRNLKISTRNSKLRYTCYIQCLSTNLSQTLK